MKSPWKLNINGTKGDSYLNGTIAGGVVTAGGLVYLIVELASGSDDDPDAASLRVLPTPDGLAASLSWRF